VAKLDRRRKEVGARDRVAEIEQVIVAARRPANGHALEHHLERPRRPRVADEVRAGVTAAAWPKGMLWRRTFTSAPFSTSLVSALSAKAGLCSSSSSMSSSATDDAFLCLGRLAMPGSQFVQVFLDHDVDSTGRSGSSPPTILDEMRSSPTRRRRRRLQRGGRAGGRYLDRSPCIDMLIGVSTGGPVAPLSY
jgi:hypothetical protein